MLVMMNIWSLQYLNLKYVILWAAHKRKKLTRFELALSPTHIYNCPFSVYYRIQIISEWDFAHLKYTSFSIHTYFFQKTKTLEILCWMFKTNGYSESGSQNDALMQGAPSFKLVILEANCLLERSQQGRSHDF